MSTEHLMAECKKRYHEYISSYSALTKQMSPMAATQYDVAVKRLIAGLKAAGGTALEDYYAWCAGGKAVQAMTATVKEVEQETQLRNA